MLPQTVQRIRPSVLSDANGNQVRNYVVPPAASKDMAAWLQQDTRKEPISEGRDPLEQIWTMATNDDDIQGYDRIVFGSLTFEVEGPPAPVYTPAGYHHTEATLRAVAG
jgi:hypothetical protein